MIHTAIGDFGHLFVIISFVAALLSAFGYMKSSNSGSLNTANSWQKYGRVAFIIHSLAVIGVIVNLFFIIYNHYYEYHYAWSHSSNNLPIYYMISCFWEGQEGSFLLWIFWHVVLGLVLILTNKYWESPVMAVFALVQAFLASMILGVVIPGLNIKIGSDPFILLRDAMADAPIFQMNPNFVPEDGNGLNPLLQNYWMVIHPPTLFLGFASTLVPFAFCIAGLWKRKFKEWIVPALPWALFSAMILGTGILMGAYWAYETLNFGGYWNWDPVENAVYIPWLVLVASYHTMIVHRNNGTALKTSIVLVITTFILILYSTFLTRSGILGEASVHSFTDLGLSGQLLLYLFAFIILSILLAASKWKEIPTSEKEASAYTREFWIFMGATVLCLMSFQVLIPTSIPVFNSIVELFGGISNMAPPADAINFYSQWQMWLAIVLVLLSGTGQFFWWNRMDKDKLKKELLVPIVITLIAASATIVISGIKDVSHIVLLTATIYCVIANLKVLLKVAKSNFDLSGGAIAHIGIALMLMGIMFSSGRSKVVSLNNTGLLYSRDLPDEVNRENLLLFLDEPRKMGDYSLIYRGQRMEVKGWDKYVNKSDLAPTNDPFKALAEKRHCHRRREPRKKR